MEIALKRFAAARYLRAACGAAVWLGLAGCGDSEKSTVPLIPAHGKVTLGGKPLPEADLEFIPLGATPGRGGFARTSTEGTYSAGTLHGESGLAAGEYKVVISKAPHSQAASSSDKPLPPTVGDEVLSPTYADRADSVLKATVPATGEATNDFDLKPGKRKTEARRAARVALP